jgi:hypothetical protein
VKQQGKFILMTLDEFKKWLSNQRVSRKIKLIQNHHTWLPDYKTFNGKNHFQLLQSMERSHMERGFAEIGQNFTTFPDGTIGVCRNMNTSPAGIKGANSIGICIEHVGNFDLGGDIMTVEHKNTIEGINAALCDFFNLTPNTSTIVYHNWFDLNTGERLNGKGSTKSCPGSNFYGGNSVAMAEKNFIPAILTKVG